MKIITIDAKILGKKIGLFDCRHKNVGVLLQIMMQR
jgi:hypothetical protein